MKNTLNSLIFTKLQLRRLFVLIKKMLRDTDIKQDKDYLRIMDHIAKLHDSAKHNNSPVKCLLNYYDMHLLWSLIKVAIDNKHITDHGFIVDLVDCMTVLAVKLEVANE